MGEWRIDHVVDIKNRKKLVGFYVMPCQSFEEYNKLWVTVHLILHPIWLKALCYVLTSAGGYFAVEQISVLTRILPMVASNLSGIFHCCSSSAFDKLIDDCPNDDCPWEKIALTKEIVIPLIKWYYSILGHPDNKMSIWLSKPDSIIQTSEILLTISTMIIVNA